MYTHIVISGRIAPLEVILTEEYALGVQVESKLAYAAPNLLQTLQTVQRLLNGTQPKDIPGALMVIESALKGL